MADPTLIATTRAGIEAQTASDDDDIWLVLLSLTCPDFDLTDIPDADIDDNTLRFVANEEDVWSREKRYIAWGFEYVPPAMGLSGNSAQIKMDNVDRRITQAIKLLPASAEIRCTVEVVLSGDLDQVEQNSPPFTMNVIDFDESNITGSIDVADDSRQALCSLSYGRAVTPGLHS